MPSNPHRTRAMIFTPGGGGSSPSIIGSWSVDIASSVQALRIERSQRTQGDFGTHGGLEIGERVVEIGSGHHDLVLDIDDHAAGVEDGHQVRATTLEACLGGVEGAATGRQGAIA